MDAVLSAKKRHGYRSRSHVSADGAADGTDGQRVRFDEFFKERSVCERHPVEIFDIAEYRDQGDDLDPRRRRILGKGCQLRINFGAFR